MRYILLISKLALIIVLIVLIERSNVLNNRVKSINKKIFISNLLFELLILSITVLMYLYAQIGTSYEYGYNCCLTHNGCIRYMIGWVGYIIFLPSVYIAFTKESLRRQTIKNNRYHKKRRWQR